MLLNNQWITEEIKKGIKQYLDLNENESTTIQNLWDTAKRVLRGMFIATESYLNKQEKSQTNNNLTLKAIRERRKTNPKVRRKEIIKIKVEIYERDRENNSKDQ